jgi:hypothetical protein
MPDAFKPLSGGRVKRPPRPASTDRCTECGAVITSEDGCIRCQIAATHTAAEEAADREIETTERWG